MKKRTKEEQRRERQLWNPSTREVGVLKVFVGLAIEPPILQQSPDKRESIVLAGYITESSSTEMVNDVSSLGLPRIVHWFQIKLLIRRWWWIKWPLQFSGAWCRVCPAQTVYLSNPLSKCLCQLRFGFDINFLLLFLKKKYVSFFWSSIERRSIIWGRNCPCVTRWWVIDLEKISLMSFDEMLNKPKELSTCDTLVSHCFWWGFPCDEIVTQTQIARNFLCVSHWWLVLLTLSSLQSNASFVGMKTKPEKIPTTNFLSSRHSQAGRAPVSFEPLTVVEKQQIQEQVQEFLDKKGRSGEIKVLL